MSSRRPDDGGDGVPVHSSLPPAEQSLTSKGREEEPTVSSALSPEASARSSGGGSDLLPGVQHHDPNLRWADKTFRLTFRQWDYAAQHVVTVGGNCRAMTNLSCAVGNLLEDLPPERGSGDDAEGYRIILTNAAGDTLECSAEGEDGEDWLLKMLVSAEIVAVEPEAREASEPPPRDQQSAGDKSREDQKP